MSAIVAVLKSVISRRSLWKERARILLPLVSRLSRRNRRKILTNARFPLSAKLSLRKRRNVTISVLNRLPVHTHTHSGEKYNVRENPYLYIYTSLSRFLFLYISFRISNGYDRPQNFLRGDDSPIFHESTSISRELKRNVNYRFDHDNCLN